MMLRGSFLKYLLMTAPTMFSELNLPRMGIRRRRRRYSGKFYTPNGKREVARRLRQIQAGQLRVSM